jgi:nucleoside-diphosphate-sugar epimerase
MSGTAFLLTGASGWFGRTALWAYEQAHGPEALRRDVIPFATRERWVDFDSPHGPVQALPLEAISNVQAPRGLLHLAFLTRDKVEELGWQRYVDTNRAITAKVTEVLGTWPTMPVVATSSGAAATLDGQPPALATNPYATLKQEEEALLEREAATRRALVFRVYAATGRFMTRPEKFALGDFLLQAQRSREIRIRATHPVTRSYVSTETLMELTWRWLGQPEGPPSFRRIDACTHTLSLQELAQMVASETGATAHQPQIKTEAQPECYEGNPDDFRHLLGEHQMIPLSMSKQIRVTLRSIQEKEPPPPLTASISQP